jgi:hypothetical protein
MFTGIGATLRRQICTLHSGAKLARQLTKLNAATSVNGLEHEDILEGLQLTAICKGRTRTKNYVMSEHRQNAVAK